MPIYEYKCLVCGEKAERLRKAGEASEVVTYCPDCHSPMKRVFSLGWTRVQGLAKDRFSRQDQVAENRQKAHERGEM